MGSYYVYMLANKGGMLYVGMTNDLKRRLQEHKTKAIPGYTSKFSISKLIFFEQFNHPIDALAAEKQIKGWVRKKKIALARSGNPRLRDLSEDW